MTLVKRLRSMTFRPRNVCAAVLASFAALSAHAEDIDIFAANSPDQHKPNVLIIIDNSSNWSATMTSNASCTAAGYPATKFGAEMCALTNVINGLNSNMRVGLMMFAETGNNGAYVRFGIRDMTSQNRTALSNLLKNLVPQSSGTDNSGSNQPYGKTMFEAFKYFGGFTNQANATTNIAGAPVSNVAFGMTAFAGGNSNNSGTYRRDYPNNNTPSNRAASFYNADNNYAYAGNNSDTYVSPIVDGCAKNFIIFISNGNPSTGGDSSSVPAPMSQIMTTLNVTPTQLPPPPATETHASKMDEMAKFLYETDVSALPGQQNVQTFTVAVYSPQNNGSISNTDQQMLNLMQSAATYGGGKFCSATTADAVATCINSVFNELQAVNSVFVSSSLPVSVNAQGTFINQVYMGMFRPDQNSLPRWMGNLKEYKIDQDSLGNLYLADSIDVPAINSTTGFVSPNAKSFWSASSTFWANNLLGTPPSATDLPDGEVVEKGGAGQKLRVTYPNDLSARNMLTCPTGGCGAGAALSYAFNRANIVTTANVTTFGAADTTELGRIVDWVRGVDNVNADPCAVGTATCPTWSSAEKGPGWPTIIRPSIHGDVLHTRPVVLNYTNLGPYVFYAANDGVLRAIKGGRDPVTDGKEAWSFIAPEFYGKYRRLRNQSPALIVPIVEGTANVKDYFFDGPIGSYQDSTGVAYIFPTARRGGRLIYAFDVSDPKNPKFMWKKTNVDLPELGQTWSEPKAVKVKASSDPVLIFGGGYDPAEDNTPAGADTMGRAVFVLNARTGALIKQFSTSVNGGGSITNAIPSDVAVIDRDQDTYADRVYVGDTGGNIWRMDIDDPNPANWKLEKFATLGSTLKFLYRPDIIPTSSFDVVLAGTGDREKPLVTTSQDYFFMLKDMATGKDGSGITPLTFGSLVANAGTVVPTNGWYLTLAAGEKVVNAPLTIGGIVFFSTNQPSPPPNDGTCAVNLGIARAYALDFLKGGAGIDRNGDGSKNSSDMAKVMPGGGLSPSPVGGVIQLDDGTTSAFCIGCGGTTGKGPSDAEKPPVTIPKVRKKTYWNVGTDS